MSEKNVFQWTKYYQELANKLLKYKNDRQTLLSIMEKVYNQTDMKYPFAYNGKALKDICPFTIFGCFNKGIKDENRVVILSLLAQELGISEEVPTSFEGIPVVNNMKAWFFGDIENRVNDIPNLWLLFEAAIDYADIPSEVSRASFVKIYNIVKNQPCVKWNISMGLYWIRPFSYLNLDNRNRTYLTSDNSIALMLDKIFIKTLNSVPDAEKYLGMIDKCKEAFESKESIFNNFPELSYSAWEATISDEESKKLSKASFLKWFIPLVDALKKLGGSSKPEQARQQIINDLNLTDEEISETRGKTNINKFENEVAFARNYLVYEDIIDKSTLGVWTLTEKGKNIQLTDQMVSDIFKKWVDIMKKRLEIGETASPDHDAYSTRYWIYAPGEKSIKWEEFYKKGVMCIAWDELGNLDDYPTRETMRTKMKELWDQNKTYMNDSLATWQFVHDIQLGDIIYAKKGIHKIVGRGVVESEYFYDDTLDEYKSVRKVKWINNGEWDYPGKAVLKTLTDISSYTDYVQKLEALFIEDGVDTEIIEEKEVQYEPYSKDDFLNEVFMDEDQYNTLVGLLKNKKNIILQGAPGVGKTFAAKRLAYSIMGIKDISRIMMVQFHQSYSYEDFIMGYRPTKDGFELTAGPFYKFCKLAQDDIEHDYFFIIDEINRGNLSKIFGELLMLIEKDKRGDKLRLLYSNEYFMVPKNVHIIGTMNTADRSLAMIDYALRRRFAFYELEPAFDSDGFKMIIDETENTKFSLLVDRVKLLNDTIAKDESLGPGFRIGHSYLCTDMNVSDEWIESVIKYELLPLINEYWFDDVNKVDLWKIKLCGVLDD